MFQSCLLQNDPQLVAAEKNAPPLGVGTNGSGVKRLQAALIALGAKMPISTKTGTSPPDGIYGHETRQAVVRFQQQNGLKADGIVGRLTLARLDARLVASGKGSAASVVACLFAAVKGFVETTNSSEIPALHTAVKQSLATLTLLAETDQAPAHALQKLLASGR